MCIRDSMYTVPQILTNKAEEFLSLAEQLAGYGYHEVNPVSYTHLDVYKRQLYMLSPCRTTSGPLFIP